jgi:predicted dehydrogenase
MVRAAIAGLGWWGQHMVRRMKDSTELQIVAAIEASQPLAAFAKEHGLAFTTSWDPVLRDPGIHAVILCTPHSMHTDQVLAVAGAGKHVFCEKPLALTRADAERSVAACRAAGVVLGIGHERRFEPAFAAMRDLVKGGSLGTVQHIEANFSHDKLANMPASSWRASPVDAPAASMTQMGVHLTDQFIDLLGPISEVYAVTTSLVSNRSNGDVASVHVRFASGATGYLSAMLVTPTYIKTTVFGSTGWAEARNETHPDTPGPTTLRVLHADGRREEASYEWADTVRANLEAFAGAIEGRATYPFTDAQKVANVAVLEAVCRSVASNSPVEVGAP